MSWRHSVRSRSGAEETPGDQPPALAMDATVAKPPSLAGLGLTSTSDVLDLIGGSFAVVRSACSQLWSMLPAFKVSSNPTALNPGHPTTLTLSLASSPFSCGGRIMMSCQRSSRLASKTGNLIQRTGRLRIRGNFGCSSERGRGETDIRERFRGSRDETERTLYAGMSRAHLSIRRYSL
jgi:hypothetical protein